MRKYFLCQKLYPYGKFSEKVLKTNTTHPDNKEMFEGGHPLAQFSSVTQSCPTPCDPMDCSSPGFPVHYQPPESTQTQVH